MQKELQQLEDFFLQHTGMNFTPQTRDIECEEYCGFTCLLDVFTIKFRRAKITPKKIGQFVTVWKRNAEGITTPFSLSDPFDFYIILTEASNQVGCFIFPKSILGEKGILTTPKQEGKRGFRVYPTWDYPTSKQAQTTQQWQKNYFILLSAWEDQPSTSRNTVELHQILKQHIDAVK
ncbi:MepB family protein [Myroides odoratus]|uniref:MepB family protein n=1 Tax=Myroides odoratus TaxID=256 RepID=UPI0033416B91